jgi:cytochrome c biogenesis protein CcdA
MPAALLLGVIASVTSCCNLPVIGAIAGYSGSLAQERKRRDLLISGVFFMIGTILALAALGAVSGFIGSAAGSTLGTWWQLIAGLILVFFGLTSLDFLPFKLSLPKLVGQTANRGRLSAMVYGLALGGGATACTVSCSPVLPVVLAYSALQGGTFWGALVLAVFAVGYSVPLAVGLIGLGLGMSQPGARTPLSGMQDEDLPRTQGCLASPHRNLVCSKERLQRGEMRLAIFTLAAVLAATLASAVRADSRDEQARAQFEQGVALYEDGKYDQAAIAFERAYELKPSYKILFNLGQAHNELGHYAAALKAYTHYLAEGGDAIDPARRDKVKGEIARLNTLVGMVLVEAEVEGAVVYVDDERQGETPLASPVFVDLGKHTVVVKRGAAELHREAVKVAGGQRVTIRVAAADEPAGPEEPAPQAVPEDEGPQRVWTWVAFGVGGAAAITAGITGGIAASKESTLADECPDKQCPQSEWKTLDSARTLATTTSALIAVAGVGIAAGIVLFFVEPGLGEEQPAVAIAPSADRNGFGISTVGRF